MPTRSHGRLLLLAYYYPPLGGAGSRRALSFAVHLARMGWDVTVVTPKEGVYGRDPSLPAGDLPGVRVLRTGTWEPSVLLKGARGRDDAAAGAAGGAFVEEADLGALGGAVRGLARRLLYYPDSAKGWVGPAAAAAGQAHREAPFDVVLSTSPPLSGHLAAQRFAKEAGLPLVLDFRDLWEPAVAGRPARARRLVEGIVRSAARVVTVSEGYADWLGGAGARERPAVVYNGFEEKAPAPGAPATAAAEPYLLHAGTTYGARQDFRPLGEALLRVRERTGRTLRLRLVGRGDAATRDRVEGLAKEGVVSVEAFRRSDEVAVLQAGAAAVVVRAWSGADAVAMGHLPAKLFEALPSGRPILLVAEPGSEAAALGRRLGLESVAPGDGRRMESIVEGLLAGRVPAGMRADPAVASGFTRRAQAEVLAGVLEEARSRKARP